MTAKYKIYDDGERSGISVEAMSYDGLVCIEQFDSEGKVTSRIDINTSTVYNQKMIEELIEALTRAKELVDKNFC